MTTLRRFPALLAVIGCTRTAPPPPASVDAPPPPAASVAEASAPAPPQTEDAAPPRSAPLAPPEGMLLVPGGTFTMGAKEGGEGDERPAHEVTLKPFFLDVTEVTQEAYGACVTAGKCRAADMPANFKGPRRPVSTTSWNDARDYCAWKDKRLPREAEFERAVRGDDGRRFPWGNDTPTPAHAVFNTATPEDVGTHEKGRGPYGHHDLTGNVWEWMEDDYDPMAYSRASANEGRPGTCAEIVKAQDKLRADKLDGFTGTNPIPTECEKSIRGGAYNYPASGLRSTNRVHHPGSFRLKMTGFRCAKDAS